MAICSRLSKFQHKCYLLIYLFNSLMEENLTLFVAIKPIKYKSINIIIQEISENILFDEFKIKILYMNLDKNPAAAPAATGLKIQFDMSNTMHDTCKSLVKYNIVFKIVVRNNANKYALNP